MEAALSWMEKRAGYAAVSNFQITEAKPLPPGTSAQLAELIGLTQDLELGKGKRVAIYRLQVCLSGATCRCCYLERKRPLTTRRSPIKYGDQILRLLEADHLPTEVSVSHCKGHQKGSTEVAQGNQAADQAARRTALQTAESLQSCSTLCDPIDGSPPGSPTPGILQARTLEWVAISFSNA